MAAPQRAEIDRAFAGNSELRKRVHAAIDQNPVQLTLFSDISNYILSDSNTSTQSASEPASKKRKLDDGGGATGNLADSAVKAWKSFPAVSFAIPQRKKLTLQLVAGKQDGGVRAVGADGSVEFGIAWRDVDQVFCLPVPDKPKRQHNFVVVPFHGDGVNPVPESAKRNGSPPEPIVWTFEELSGKNIVEGEDPGPAPMSEAIDACLAQAGVSKHVVFPDTNEFASAIPQNHRKGEAAFHVKAHRGSKEGYLFFTAVGIVYGFKKPLAIFDFASINAISYTNVLRNTFNLVISTQTGDIEFSMIDQADYEGICAYVSTHGLQDASMAAARRAKKLNINPPAEGQANGANGVAAAADGESELQKAERQIAEQEEDDEEDDEDFDPGSEGESEGSGTDDSDDEDGNGAGYDEGETEEVYDDGYEDEDAAMDA